MAVGYSFLDFYLQEMSATKGSGQRGVITWLMTTGLDKQATSS
jgi:hypothetical protein